MGDSHENETIMILEQSLELVKKLYDELDASAESINVRAGIVLGLIASALTASNFATWSFTFPLLPQRCRELFLHQGLHTLSWVTTCAPTLRNVLIASSLLSFIVGTWLVAKALLTRISKLPYNLEALQNQKYSEGQANQEVFTSLRAFYGKQLDNFVESIYENRPVINRKGINFNWGIFCILVALGLIILSKILP